MAEEVKKTEYLEVGDDEFIIKQAGDYVLVEEGEPIECHVESVKKVITQNFEKTGDVEKAVIGFKLDEGEGQGQVYTKWLSPSNNPKSIMFKLMNALYGTEWPEEVKLARDLPGRSLRILLKNQEKDGVVRQNVEGYLKRSKKQSETVAVDSAEITDASQVPDLDAIFG